MAAVGLAAALAAQEPVPVVRVARVEAHPQLDGSLDEPVWLTADSITDFRQRDPREGAPSTERTVARFLATPQGLWVGFWCFDSQPDGIRRTQLRRDADLDPDDWVGLVLDPQRDRRSGYAFQVNPNGAIADAEILNQEHTNGNWNGVWDARARVHDWGWSAELFIPWQVLRYPDDADTWGVNVGRYIRRTNEETLWRAWLRQQGPLFLEEEGLLSGLTGLPPRSRFEGRPYVAARAEADARDYDAAGNDSVTAEGGAGTEVGFDGKLAVAPTLTLDLTVNTDFAQVEVDNQVVNLSRFPVFFPEKREFFLESSGTFDFGAAGRTQLFYSRRIGLHQTTSVGPGGDTVRSNEPVPIMGGLRLTGRVGPERLGILAVRTGGSEDALDVVARTKHDLGSRGYAGAMLTVQGGPGVSGTRLGAGADINVPLIVGGQNLIPQAWAAVTDNHDGTPRASAWSLTLDYPNDLMDHVVNVSRTESGFDPALGFVRQDGIWRALAAFRFFPRPGIPGVRRLRLTLLEAETIWRLDGSRDNAEYEIVPLGVEFQSGDEVQLSLQRGEDHPQEDRDIFEDVVVPAGSYGWNRAEASFESSWGRPVSAELSVSAGQFYDGTGEELQYEVEARVAPHVLAGAEGAWQWVRLPGGSFTAQVHRLRLDYAANPRLNTTLFVQWDNETERLTVNARLHWIPSPGSDAYLVWDSAWPTWLEGGLDAVPWRQPLRGALVGKFVYYFRL